MYYVVLFDQDFEDWGAHSVKKIYGNFWGLIYVVNYEIQGVPKYPPSTPFCTFFVLNG